MNAPMSPYSQIESKAKLADPSNRQSIQDLAHQVLIQHHVYSIPDSVAGVLEDRLTDAEIRFRNKTGRGVSERQLLDFMNLVAVKLHLPEYAKTTPAQLRNLRMRLSISSPAFMGTGLTDHGLTKGDSINVVMSPLQAMHLFNVMVDQKVLNDLYQDPSIDIVRAEEQRHKERQQKALAQGRKSYVAEARVNPHGLEMLNALAQGANSLSVKDALDIVDEVFTAMSLR